MFRITKDLTIGELLDKAPELASVLNGIGMHCTGCPSARAEALEQETEMQRIDVNDLIENLKGFMEMM